MAKSQHGSEYRAISAHWCRQEEIHVQMTRLDPATRRVIVETLSVDACRRAPSPTRMYLAIAKAATLLSGLPWQEILVEE